MNLSKEDARKLILEQEQQLFYIDFLEPEYNILKKAGSSLGFKLSAESKVLMSLAKSGENHPMYGKNHSAEAIAKMSEAKIGKTHSAETKALMSKTHKSIDRTRDNYPMFGQTHTAGTKDPLKLVLLKEPQLMYMILKVHLLIVLVHQGKQLKNLIVPVISPPPPR